MKKLLVFLVCTYGMYACETIIDVDLNTADPKTVVDAALCAQDSVHTILLTSSGRFQDAQGLQGISNASILIDDGNGNSATFSELTNAPFAGIYTLENYPLLPGATYQLTVQNGDETITATSTLAQQVQIDSMYFEKSFFPTPEDEEKSYLVHIVFQDPPGIDNYYRVLATVNDTLQRRKSITSDKYTDGQERDYMYFGSDIYVGDTVTIELWTLNKAAHDFYITLDDILSSGGGFASSTPYNPITNLSSGLGHFSVYQRSVKTAIVSP